MKCPCGKEILIGDQYGTIEGKNYCEKCFEEKWLEINGYKKMPEEKIGDDDMVWTLPTITIPFKTREA